MKSKSILPLFAVLCVVAIALFSISFKGTKEEAFVNWYYIPDTVPTGTDMYQPGNYTNTPPDNCGGASAVPCQIEFTGANLASYLSGLQTASQPVPVLDHKDL